MTERELVYFTLLVGIAFRALYCLCLQLGINILLLSCLVVYLIGLFIYRLCIYQSVSIKKAEEKAWLGSAIFSVMPVGFTLVKAENFQYIVPVLIVGIVCFTIASHCTRRYKYVLPFLTLLFLMLFFLFPSYPRNLVPFYREQSSVFMDPGTINEVNILRSNEENQFIGKLLYNKFIYLYKYAGNILALLNPEVIGRKVLFVLLIPMIVGLNTAIRKKNIKASLIVLLWLVVVTMILGLNKYAIQGEKYILMVPMLTILILQGIKKYDFLLWLLVVCNVAFEYILMFY
ncbi:MAG: hypothetical protein GYA62_11225 [Bacteroidales bacterium]|jgi:hypothetical protein|nr:hypothetical protein [Bacteroidales bacterium]